MNEDRLAGTARNLGGKVEEGFGRVTGDLKSQAQGKAKQVEGDLQDLYGQAKDTAMEAAQVVRDSASEAEDYIRKIIEQSRTRPPPWRLAWVSCLAASLVAITKTITWLPHSSRLLRPSCCHRELRRVLGLGWEVSHI
jgi:uncharacterized protein YjbJ (UPF0337 family)